MSYLSKNWKKLLKTFIIVFLLVFLVWNFDEIKGLFNYKLVYSDFYYKHIKGESVESMAEDSIHLLPLSENKTEIKTSQPRFGEEASPEKNNFIEIPKISIGVPIIFQESAAKKDLENALNGGVVHYPESSLPGEGKVTIILGHSAPPGWKKNYEWAFSRLNELENGDEIFVYYDNWKFRYVVNNKFFLKPGSEIPVDLSVQGQILYLLTCWPPGKNVQRLVIEAIRGLDK